MIKNSELRFLIGYEQDLSKITEDFTFGLQYYLEYMMDYDEYQKALPQGIPERDEYRHVFTLRLSKLMMQQNLQLSLFTYYSPSDADIYLRPFADYKITDHWTASVGGNIFTGRDADTFFGQFDKNSNLYAAVRYGF